MWGSRAPKRGDGTSAGLIVESEVLGADRTCDVDGRGQPQPMQVKLRLGSLLDCCGYRRGSNVETQIGASGM
jgi:hypothetical protein